MPFPHPHPPGRPKGIPNKIALAQRQFAEAVCYGPDGLNREQGKKEFAMFIRQQMLAGELPPIVFQTLIFYLLGKPQERIEISNAEEFQGVSIDELRQRLDRLRLEADSLATIDVAPQKSDDTEAA